MPVSSAMTTRPLALGFPASEAKSPKPSAAISGHVQPMLPKPKLDALLLLVRREILINEREIAKRQRKATSDYSAEITEITHKLMRGASQ